MDGYLPFDPDKIKPPEKPKPARRERARGAGDGGKDALSVSEVTARIKAVLESHTDRPLRVVGEVSNFNDRGHWYFSLKDEKDVLSCVMWSSASKKMGFVPERGLSVVATGRLDYYGPQGKLQLYVDRLEPVGAGALELRYQQLVEQLRERGWFDAEAKRELPGFAEHVAVVTSATSAAVADVIKTARQRWAGCKLSVVDVRVQGEGAAGEVAAAIGALSREAEGRGIDAIIVTRGGGSLEDLWAFNEVVVAEAIRACAVPVVAAIGHETDVTIAELVADRRCSTPTQAAMAVVPDGGVEAERVGQIRDRLVGGVKRRGEVAKLKLAAIERMEMFRTPAGPIVLRRRDVEHVRQRLVAAMETRLGREKVGLAEKERVLATVEPGGVLDRARERVAGLRERLVVAGRGAVEKQTGRLEALERQLEAIGPQRVLERGYSLTLDAEGRVVDSVDAVKQGDRVRTRVADGSFESEVTGRQKVDREP